MATVLITVAGPEQLIDLELPADVALRELLPLLVEVCAPRMAGTRWAAAEYWGVGYPDGQPLAPERTLIECGIHDGEMLAFQDIGSWSRPAADSPTTLPLALAQPVDTEEPVGVGSDGIVVRWNKDL